MNSTVIGLLMAVGLVGVVVPLLPGTALVLAAGVLWAVLVVEQGTARWVVVAVMTVLLLAGLAAKYALPGKRLSGQLPRSTLVLGAAGAVVGFFVVPLVGLALGAVAGVYLAETRRYGTGSEAWRSTVRVLQAIGLGILAELVAGVLMVATWVVGLVVT